MITGSNWIIVLLDVTDLHALQKHAHPKDCVFIF